MDLPELPASTLDQLNAIRGGFNEMIGLHFVSVSYEEVVGKLELRPAHHQPYGLVHGGVYSAMVETIASVGAALNLGALDLHTVGLENHTSFLRAVRSGTLVGRGLPLARGRRTQVWEVSITHEGKLAASGRVRLLGIERGSSLAGEVVAVKSETP
ncbi:putative esterase [Enhygromyxa salina]|uniref:Putative esterase n=1 Tax=Enhygromyxa salina TaxID=215803 RepID=A0A2S9YHD2_9BACT|nr:PaaI family thioesterase [Enhygromyxa salina]PRQ04416.1 putative esterase [Enhygromyxa salina]